MEIENGKADLAGRYFVARPYGGRDEATGKVIGHIAGDTWLVSLDPHGECAASLHLVTLDLMHAWDFFDKPGATGSPTPTGYPASTPGFAPVSTTLK